MKRNSYQHGSIYLVPLKSGPIWRLRYRRDGKQYSDYIGTLRQYPAKADAAKAAERMMGIINGPSSECVTMGELVDRFLREAMPPRASTINSYKSLLKRIRAAWGDTRIDKFTLDMVQVADWLDGMVVVGRHPKRGKQKPVSGLYKTQVKAMLHLLMEKAMLWGAIQMQRNPLEVVKLKGSSERAKEIIILTIDQYRQLLDDEELPELVKVIIQVTAALGLRISETMGLKWTDLDFEAGTVEIQRGVVGMEANDVKTPGSRQKLPLHPELIDVLRTWRAAVPVVGDWVFGSERTGRPYDRDSMREEYLKPAGARIGLPGIGWHSLRHTYRALQKQLGLPMETQKSLMRHSRIATTIDTYGGNDNIEQTRPANSRVIEMLPWRRRA